jgi:anthranilate 1,2-dioxygenase small subunit
MTDVTPELYLSVTQLLETYGRLIDEDRLEAWAELFTPDCRYEIISRENRDQGLPLSLMLCDSRDMLDDRIYSLRNANIFNIHSDCHVLGPARVEPDAAGLAVSAAYSLFQTNQGGETRLFSVGRYHFGLIERDGVLMIQSAQVVVDTGAILTLLATPI